MATLAPSTRSNTITLASAGAGPFLVGFRLFETNSLAVFVNGVASTAWTLTANFAAGYDDTAAITFGSALAAADVIQIEGELIPRREADYLPADPGLTRKLNIELPRLWLAIQELTRKASRSVRSMTAMDAFMPEVGRSIIFDADLNPIAGPTSDEIANAQSYAERAELAAGALTSLTDRVPYSFLITTGNSGRGPYALPYDPGAVDLIDLYVNGLMQSSADHFEIVVMPAAASGKGLQFLDAQTTGHRVDLKFALPLGYDPAVNTAMDFATLADFQAAVTAGLTRVNGRYLTAAGTGYVAEAGAALAGIPAGWRPVDWVYSKAELQAATWEVAPGRNVIHVLQSGIVTPYLRTPFATDLIAGDLSEWEKAGLNAADAVQIGLDVAMAAAVVTNADVRATYGGAANAITLATGKPFTTVPTGARIRFSATAANTGATTISVDGLPVVTAKTQAGADLPANHIRTDVEMVATYNGTNWIVTRAISWGGTLVPTMQFGTPGTSSFVYGTQQGWWRRENNVVSFHGVLVVTPTKGTASGNVSIALGFLDELGAAATVVPIYNGNGAAIHPVTITGAVGYPGPAGTLGPVGEMRHDSAGRIRLGHHLLTDGVVSRAYFSTTNITDGVAITMAFSGSFVVAP